jgi:hypothetical protein
MSSLYGVCHGSNRYVASAMAREALFYVLFEMLGYPGVALAPPGRQLRSEPQCPPW